jgi:hypothetical protein
MSNDLDEMIVEMLEAANAYSKTEHVALTTLGRFIVNDGGFFENLTLSKNCTIKTYRKVMKWFADKQAESTRMSKAGKTTVPKVAGKERIRGNPKKELNRCFSS